MKTNLEIVFFHEVGHLVAQQLNSKLFGTGEVEEILLIEYNISGVQNFLGKTISKVPQGKSQNTPLINLPEKIAELIYGCYFQSLYLNQELNKCFDCYNQFVKGKQDCDDLVAALTMFKVPIETRKRLYPYLLVEYFEFLQSHKNDFKEVLQENPKNFLFFTTDGYRVDIGELQIKLQKFFIDHEKTYKNFVQEIKRILDWKNIY
ncbi:hypothetical protein [Aequorivita antarctica]|uniref:Uncharacterized protein n=1 Tax=Aequorivita antarctica TaxID=153266 RepID=A0A5C6Z2F9_9FLAO|nr:hypothetical protein [Aequorivita antarctica]TXD73571.1 hypothetical protein ESU54_07350 [Aequorivita antarctica]SRX75010.1 hypothetical protein AEQU3_01997 [Aequorivita antarctica]